MEIFTIQSFFNGYLGVDPEAEVTVLDWLTLPEQRVLTIIGGRVFQDDGGQLQAIRNKFRYYPQDVQPYLLAAQWMSSVREEALDPFLDSADLEALLLEKSQFREKLKALFI